MAGERLSDSPEFEQKKGISKLLSNYYEKFDDRIIFEPLISYVIDDHEVAWMKYNGIIEYDITGEGKEGQLFEGKGLYCECNFKEGVGWKVKDGEKYSLDGSLNCKIRKRVVAMRHEELRKQYENFYLTSEKPDIKEYTEEIILDLIEKGKRDEFLEDGNGAQFWGGYFYLQTVRSITGESMDKIWKVAKKMIIKNKISVEGTVVQEYYPAPAPEWKECLTIEQDGFIAKASLPSHSKMDQNWRIELIAPNGEPMIVSQPHLGLNNAPYFGPDVDDVEDAKMELKKLLEAFKEQL